MVPARKRRRADFLVEEEDENHPPDVLAAAQQDLSRGGIELSGHGIVNNDSRLEIGRDFKVVHIKNHFHSPTASQDKAKSREKDLRRALKRQRRLILSSLAFPQIGLREMNVGEAHNATCQWFLKKPAYLDWLDKNQFGTHNGLLWIKGKPGAGKSTLIKHVLSQIRQEHTRKLVVSFFFYARGETLERSTVGLYRSLLIQLFNARPYLIELLDSLQTGHQWTIQSLESLFRVVMLALQDSTLICFIDGLDECEEVEIRKMLSFLTGLSSRSSSDSDTRLLICCTSRYYPNITMKKGLIIRLEDQDDHRDDISHYIDSILNIGNTELAMKIRYDLWNGASGVFMWVVLVVDILNREYDGGRPDRLRQRLQDIPNDLHDLFHSILTRGENDPDALLCCIQWILFSKRPLSPQEHYFATLSGIEPHSIPACHSDISVEDITRYILRISKGLAEIVGAENPVVQFIHESVRDFLLNQNGIQKIRQDLGCNVQGYSHEKLRSCCAEYMLSDPVRQAFCLETAQNEIGLQGVVLTRQEIVSRYPFLEYATKYILRHAEEAERHAISQSHFLSTFPRAMWIRQVNVYEKYTKYSPNTTLLYILAELNLPNLIRVQPPSQSCFAIEEGRFGAPILAALVTGSSETVQALLEVQVKRLPPSHGDSSLINELLTKEINVREFRHHFVSLQGRSLATYLAQFGSEAIFRLFLATEDGTIDSKDSDGATPLSWAARFGHGDIVELLLEKGANVHTPDTLGRTPLSWAAAYGQLLVVRFLIERGANVNHECSRGWGPLAWAIASPQTAVAIAQMLLANGANVDSRDYLGRSPLYHAAIEKDSTLCQVLISGGADIDARDDVGRTPLSIAAGFNKEYTARLLLDNGASINVNAYNGGDLLSWASASRYSAMGRLILSRAPNP
ncbi:hypothetical protein F4777DRAFT_252914 [Nemania sp. FL0916]|nr:hypothetical protein F4777DRAFT_252914 [Nemania sp. FL0916]